MDVRVVTGGVEAQVGQAFEQRVDRHPRLHPGQMHPQAHVRPVPEGDVLLRVTEDVESVGVVVAARVAVGRAEHHGDVRAGR